MEKLKAIYLKLKNYECKFKQELESQNIWEKMNAELYFAVKDFLDGKDK